MLLEFKQYINDNALFLKENSILLAVSGGIDSMVMAHLFHQAEFNFGIAHCNFSLRGNESELDEAFVRSFAVRLNIPFYTKKFSTDAFAKANHLGIQEAARMLRYEWFNELIKQESFDFIATAHHLDDNIETLFLNLLRGCSISGLHGILPKRDHIIRPLLFASKANIEQFAMQHHIEYREDSSNKKDKYTRNKLRHYLIPVIEEIQPQFRSIMYDNINRFREAEKIYINRIKQYTNELVQKNKDGCSFIDIDRLKKSEAPKTILFEILSPFGFKKEIMSDIFEALSGQSGKKFLSENFILSKHRNYLLLYAKEKQPDTMYYIESDTTELSLPIPMNISSITVSQQFTVEKKCNVAYLDYEKLTFPLKIKKPQKGDSFIPFGMKGRKKLSDFMIDCKFSQAEKEATWLLCSDNKIVWIINRRISDLFKITKQTKKILIIEVKV